MRNSKHLSAGLLAALCAITFGAQSALAVRTDVAAVSPKNMNQGTIAADSADVTLTAVDTVNNNSVTLEAGMCALIQNSGASAYTVTFTSVADDLGRTGDITYSLGAGEFALIGPVTLKGWRQTDGKLYYTGNNAAVKVLFIRPTNANTP